MAVRAFQVLLSLAESLVSDAPSFVPWALLEPHKAQAQRNHFQTLERLAERGGLSICEIAAVIGDHPFQWRQHKNCECLAEVKAAVRTLEDRPRGALLSVEECVYWAVVADVPHGIEDFSEIVRAIVRHSTDRLRRMAARSLENARCCDRECFPDYRREHLFAWWLCRAAIRAIERERAAAAERAVGR